MASIVLAGSSSGAITVAAPAVAGTNTITLPASTSTLATTADITGPAFLAVSGANQSVTSGAITKVSINTEQFDTNSNYDTSTYRFTPTVAGYYQVSGMVKILGSLTASQVIIYKNGALVVAGNYFIVGAQSALFNTVEGLIYMNGSSDYLELFGYVVGTSPVFTYTSIYNTSRFSAFLARAA